MSTQRFMRSPPNRYDAEGNKVCVMCGGALTGRRTRYCSPKCVDDFMIRYSGDYLRRALKKRDKGICALCGEDTHGDWHADHIIPVCRGGGECGLENLRTLCTKCHKAETKKLAAELAEERRQAKQAEKWVGGQGRLF